MSSATYGYSGDSFGSIYYFWWWKYTFLHHLPFRINPLQEAPFGVTFDQETGVIFFYWPVKLLSLVTNAVFAYNFILILSFPLAGLAMYLLVREVLSGWSRAGKTAISDRNLRLVAFIAGLIFAFCPYHYWKAFQHLDLALTWCLPFFIYTLIRFEKFPSLKNSLLMAFGFLSNILTNYYYGYFALLFVIIFGTARFCQIDLKPILSRVLSGAFPRPTSSQAAGARRGPPCPRHPLGSDINEQVSHFSKKLLGFSVLSVFFIFAVVGPLTYPVIKDARQAATSQESFVRRDSYQRPFLNLVSLSSRPWDYLIPSQDHLLWGKYVPELYKWIQGKGSDFKTVSTFPHERTIYLGIVTIIGALYSIYLYLKGRIRSDLYLPLLVTAASFFLISMPPYIFLKGRTIWLPSSLLYRFFPMFRSYVRAGVVVLICLLVVAGFGMTNLLEFAGERFKSKSIMVALILSLIVIFDFINVPPFKVTKFLPLSSAYAWLEEQPDEPIIIEYPQSFNVADGLLYQMYHQKPFLNFHTHSPYFGLWSNISDFYNFRAPEKLAALGVDYALIHKELLFPQENPVDDLWYTRALREPLDYERLSPEFKLVEDFPEAVVYEVATEDPPKMIVVTEKAGEICVDVVGGSDWEWGKGENRIYIMDLVTRDKGQETRVKLRFEVGSESSNALRAISFNGEIIDFSNSLDLVLRPGENILLFECVEPSLQKFDNIRLEVL